MGQKTNPIGLRIAVNKDWRSKWYAEKKEFGKLLTEDRQIRDLLKKTFRALKPGGIIAIAEWLVNNERTEPTHALMFAVQMLVNSEKGDTFSFDEIKSWLGEAGFEKVRKLDAPGPSPLILATKP